MSSGTPNGPSPFFSLHLPRSLAGLLAVSLLVPAATADESTVRVKGYFCNEPSEQVAFLTLKAQGESDEMAANAVNKTARKLTCAYYRPATAVQTGEKTIMDGGVVYKVQGYLFLPERVERWTGTLFGSLRSGAAKQDI
jgi:hypothetical protein